MSDAITIEAPDQTIAPITDTTPNPGEKGESSEITFTPEQQKLLDKRIAEARRDGKKSAESEIAEAKRLAAEQAERDRQIKAGEFDEARKSLEAERDEAKAKAAQLDTLVAAIKPDVDAQWAALPVEVTELYEGDGDDVLAKRSHITRHKKLIDRLTEKQDAVKAAAGFGRTPQPNGKEGVPPDASREQASIYRSTF